MYPTSGFIVQRDFDAGDLSCLDPIFKNRAKATKYPGLFGQANKDKSSVRQHDKAEDMTAEQQQDGM